MLERARAWLRSLRMVAATAGPGALLAHLRHRRELRRVTRALHYHRFASALLLAHELGVFEALARGAGTADAVAVACGIGVAPAEALLRIVESEGMVQRGPGGGFALGGFGDAYLARGGARSLAESLDLMAAHARAFDEVVGALATGRTPAALDVFSEKSRYPAFLGAVNAYLHAAGWDLLARVALPPIRTFVVGSMGVSFSALVLARHPEARVTYGCLGHLVREIPALRRRYRVPEARVAGTHVHAGDPEADRWGDEAFDLVFLTKKMILDPGRGLGERFARKAFAVLRPSGVAILWETLHGEGRPTPLGRAMEAVLDLGASPAGPALTEAGLGRLLGGIGFRAVEVVPCLEGATTFVVARR